MKRKIYSLVGFLAISCVEIFGTTPNYLTPLETAVYNQHETEINYFTKIIAGEKITELDFKYSIDSAYLATIKELIIKRELRKSIFNYIYPDNDASRYQAKLKINQEFDGLITKELLNAGEKASTYNYSLVLTRRKTLKLSQEQFDTIVNKAVEVNKLLENNPKFDVWGHELNTFKNILTNEQLDKFFIIKNQSKINYQANISWEKLKKNGLDFDLDSAKVKGELIQYHAAILKATDLYYNNDSLKREAWRGIDSFAPIAIARIKAQSKSQSVKKSYAGSFSW